MTRIYSKTNRKVPTEKGLSHVYFVTNDRTNGQFRSTPNLALNLYLLPNEVTYISDWKLNVTSSLNFQV